HRVFRRQRADAADEHGADALRATGRGRVEPRAGVVLDGSDARAHEFRGHAGGEPEIQSRTRGGRGADHAGAPAHVPPGSPLPAPLRLEAVQRAARLSEGGRRVDRQQRAARGENAGRGAADRAVGRVSVRVARSPRDVMNVSRREFVRDGVAAFTLTFAAPGFLADIGRAQGARSRNLVVVYLSGGNDSLSTLIPYTDAFYYSRRPAIGVPVGQVLQVGSDKSGVALGLHPRLTGLREVFNQGSPALIQRTGSVNSSRSLFQGLDIWGSADPASPQGMGWLGRYLDTIPLADTLVAWNTTRETPRALLAR